MRPGLQSVAVPYFENETTEPELEVTFTDAIIEGLIADRTLRYASEEEADALVMGTIEAFQIREVFFGSDRQAEEYEVRVSCKVRLVDRASGEVLVEPTAITGKGSYFVSEGVEGEEQARQDAAEEVVRGILNLVIEEW